MDIYLIMGSLKPFFAETMKKPAQGPAFSA